MSYLVAKAEGRFSRDAVHFKSYMKCITTPLITGYNCHNTRRSYCETGIDHVADYTVIVSR